MRDKWAINNPELRKEVVRKSNLKRRAKIQAHAKENPESRKETQRKWRVSNLDKVCFYAATYRANKLRATPKWANLFYIEEIYSLAKLRSKLLNIKSHVDHIIPLQSKVVCGLHNEFNLQLLPDKVNKSKGNKLKQDDDVIALLKEKE